MVEHGDDLFQLDARKPLQELVYTCAGLEILEQVTGNRVPLKDASAAYFLTRALNFWVVYPIKHGHILCRDKLAEQEALELRSLNEGFDC